MGDQDQPDAEFLLQLDDQRQDLRLDRDIERGGRLVRDQQRRPARQRHRDHGALAHAAGKLMRIFLRPPLRFGNPDQAQHLDGLASRPPCAVIVAMQANRFGDLVADPHHRVERGHRLLENHRDAVAADRAHLGLVEAEQVGAFEHHGAADDPARRIGHQPHDRQRGHALAAAGLADDRQRLAAADAERDVVDRLEQPRIGEEHRLQVLHVENRLVRLALRSSAALPRVEDVAQRVAEQIGAEHRKADGDARGRSPATARCGHIPPPIPTACVPMTDRARECRGRETTARLR